MTLESFRLEFRTQLTIGIKEQETTDLEANIENP
ncbi:hypothetical protein C8D95_105308 [Silicimonas algicola]|uniref:Uncharacterized protein n=1 Tax=Silicimonas algicola TaxID=1826607 RepID=A0A316G941_9RHOB|nr:hypothetical protein C8D95_105308 [Silicimonas algicola]